MTNIARFPVIVVHDGGFFRNLHIFYLYVFGHFVATKFFEGKWKILAK